MFINHPLENEFNKMTEQAIIHQFIALAEGKLTAEDWKNWFAENAQSVEKICGRTAFLKIKPFASFSDAQNIYMGQTGAFNWLKSKTSSLNWLIFIKLTTKKNLKIFAEAKTKNANKSEKELSVNWGI